jgi:hypothetical protein
MVSLVNGEVTVVTSFRDGRGVNDEALINEPENADPRFRLSGSHHSSPLSVSFFFVQLP